MAYTAGVCGPALAGLDAVAKTSPPSGNRLPCMMIDGSSCSGWLAPTKPLRCIVVWQLPRGGRSDLFERDNGTLESGS
jgi:hypothetical protein